MERTSKGVSPPRGSFLRTTMMILTMFFVVTSFTVILPIEAQDDDIPQVNRQLPECPFHNLDNMVKYHSQCPVEDPLQRHQIRHHAIQKLLDSGVGASKVPDRRTIVCPEEGSSSSSSASMMTTMMTGLDTKWIVENTSTQPVVVSWIQPDTGVERSAVHPTITPPQNDPDAILQPTEWMAVDTYQGHTFLVREYDPETSMTGRVVLQYREGLHAFWSPHTWDCRKNVTTVQEEVVQEKDDQGNVIHNRRLIIIHHDQKEDLDNEPVNEQTGEIVDDFARTPTDPNRKCNAIDVGFRNRINCPIDVYFAYTLDQQQIPREGSVCQELFRFHLGRNHKPQNFFKDWKSSTKWEGTYIGHTWIARLKVNREIVVDSYTVEPTRIVDCPWQKKTATTDVKTQPTVAMDVSQTTGLPDKLNVTCEANQTTSFFYPLLPIRHHRK